MTRVIGLAAALLAIGCGSTDPCAGFSGTCITLAISSTTIVRIDAIDIAASGAVTGSQTSTANGAQTLPVKVAVRLVSTASGALHLDVTGRIAGAIVGTGSVDGSIVPGKHTTMSVDLEGAPSGGGGDMAIGGDDGMQSGDMAATPDTPRLLAPLSTSTVTSTRPILKWTIPSGAGTPAVDICSDQACSTMIANATISGSQAGPTTDLPYGPVFWRVRSMAGGATLSSATWEFFVPHHSASTNVNVGVGTILDVNRDGLPDAVIGAPGTTINSIMNIGRVFVLTSASPTGVPSLLPVGIDGAEGANAGWGTYIASAGDINGDGYADLLVGAPKPSSMSPGKLYVYYGSANGILTATPQIIVSPSNTPGFGIAAAAGDVDGDGYGDVVVGEFHAKVVTSADAGRFYVFYGSAAGLKTTAGSFTTVDGFDGPGGELGYRVAGAADFDGDGYSDVLVSAVGALDNSNNIVGRVYAYRGSSTGLLTTTPYASFQGPNVTGSFGYSMAILDLNNDGYSDVAVGEYQTGAVDVYLSSGSGAGSPFGAVTTIAGPNGSGSSFGQAVANAGDINADGYNDLIIGSPNATVGANTFTGIVDIYPGSATGVTMTPIVINGIDNAGRSGSAVAGFGDMTNDGYADVLIGAPGTTGRAVLYEGQASGVMATPSRNWPGADTNGRLGSALY